MDARHEGQRETEDVDRMGLNERFQRLMDRRLAQGREPSPERSDSERRLAAKMKERCLFYLQVVEMHLDAVCEDNARRSRGYIMRYLDEFERVILDRVNQRLEAAEKAIENRVTLNVGNAIVPQTSLGDQPVPAAQSGLGDQTGRGVHTTHPDDIKLEELCDRHYETLQSRLLGNLRVEMEAEKEFIRGLFQQQNDSLSNLLDSHAKPLERHVEAETRVSITFGEGSST
ncbi:hypothetical protein PGT21_036084 [Puccinia graminis f. sp. tritici]|uniref:Uncharacterized protein n=1 Tax=Puccinia graminis f. sp. tritici TaxID=56615 RepID=A0A5B0PDT2_PUCGR|nr:hypothetical protein PGT21_036084 [Puccinia graminis f. sp. tritici]KAA1100347.1 hypothetical protein PGTUg99_021182 [Puccinia graminis f. sp. tritici]KAA1100533.1 hypothetical protein PGTUg99_018254 [Puccinia graminis f. sp. tritici]